MKNKIIQSWIFFALYALIVLISIWSRDWAVTVVSALASILTLLKIIKDYQKKARASRF